MPTRELLKRTNNWRKAKYRDSAIYLARKNTHFTVEELGKLFGERQHSTISRAVWREEQRLKRKPPRHDKRTWVAWHAHLLDKASAPTVKPTPKAAPEPLPAPVAEEPAPEAADDSLPEEEEFDA